MTKPSIFIGSSREGLRVAQAIEFQFQDDAEITIWNEGLFNLSSGALETLVNSLDQFDFAVLVLTPDDLLLNRGAYVHSPRDNVLFELGLFMGRLGRLRTFIVCDKSAKTKLPSDLGGITVALYDGNRQDGNLKAAVGPACTLMRDSINSIGNLWGKVFSLPQRVKDYKNLTNDIVQEILLYLRNDQDVGGFHEGQFGRGQRPDEEEKYQPGKEKLDTKPRLYITGWPVFILYKHRDVLSSNAFEISEMLERAETGVSSLFEDGWIRVAMGARKFTNPLASGDVEAISYRHTIRGAQILSTLDNTSFIAKDVLGKMLDPTTNMQTAPGGWRQCATDFTEEDLWGSAYAAGFLYSSINEADKMGLKPDAVRQALKALQESLSWLHAQWLSNNWSYNEASPEENAPILFCEVAAAAIKYRPELANDVINRFVSYLDLLSQPCSSYLNSNKLIGPCAASARLAYAFFMMRGFHRDAEIWQPLKAYSLTHMSSGYNCIEASMLLDLLLSDGSIF